METSEIEIENWLKKTVELVHHRQTGWALRGRPHGNAFVCKRTCFELFDLLTPRRLNNNSNNNGGQHAY